MTHLFAVMYAAVEGFVTRLLAAELTSTCDLTWYIFHLFAAVTANRHANVTRRTGTWMAQDWAIIVLAVLVPGLLAVLATRVRQQHWVVVGLFEATAEAAVLRHLVLRVAELAVRAGPIEEG